MLREGLMLEFTDHRYANNLPGPYIYSLICIHVYHVYIFDRVNRPDNVTSSCLLMSCVTRV